MRKSRAETAETKKRIVEVAAREFRRNGIHATAVADIMAAAGLTHGGFYRHFESKEQLVAAACDQAMDVLFCETVACVEKGDSAFLKHMQAFLSEECRDDLLGGCPLVAFGSEIARADAETRKVASQSIRNLVDLIASQERFEDPAKARGEAMYKLSTMIGAVTLARIVDDPKLSSSILSEARKRLTMAIKASTSAAAGARATRSVARKSALPQ